MMKRLTSILLTLAMLVGLLPALSPQAEATAGGGYRRRCHGAASGGEHQNLRTLGVHAHL